ncbi:hypothetical protein V500_08088 [Pseudogymnoascus sp. VKM F-4518 (FW-2643)]|nr:hypothetical protein V500_08088 [Pseudogymnoascus sp. VKM F-4518 (FW-2643)]
MPKETKTKRATKPRGEKKKKGQVGKVLGERWKALNDKQRTPYETKAQEDKKRYEDEKASYNADAEEESG